jgi:Peptidase M50B-like
MASSLVASLDRIGQVQQHLPAAATIVMALLAVAAVLPAAWSVTRHLQVMAHEGAHATMASALGLKIRGIEFNRDGGGGTDPGPRGPGANFLLLLVGYLGPTTFGIGAAALISAGYIIAVLWIAVVALVAILSVLRRSFGVVTVLAALILLFLVAGFTPVGVQVVAAYVLAWFLLVAGLRRITELGKESDDGGKLRDLTKIPKGFWYRVWLVGTVAGLLFGAILLI